MRLYKYLHHPGLQMYISSWRKVLLDLGCRYLLEMKEFHRFDLVRKGGRRKKEQERISWCKDNAATVTSNGETYYAMCNDYKYEVVSG
mmetsp:Transcript_23033/g.26229  ORF Transcript_23033/g.26229 Transcript_23033/m.26229 type:complete len:88 (+) Transcript_23033:312-575(+)